MSQDPAGLRAALSSAGQPLDAALEWFLAAFACDLGTVHRLAASGLLELAAERALPPVVRDKVRTIPIGKGMAGLAAERREAVHVCNLQQDESGTVRPGARATGMEGSIAVPILDGDGALHGVLGIAQATPREWTEEECDRLLALARELIPALAG